MGRFKVYALADPSGRILEIHRVTSSLPGAEIFPSLRARLEAQALRTGRSIEALAEELRALRWQRITDGTLALQLCDRPGAHFLGPDGSFLEKPEVRLSIDTEEFVADGQDRAQVMVVGALPPETWPVRIRINDQDLDVEEGQVVEIASKAPGLWRVAIVDERVYAEVESRLVRGVAPA